MIRGLPHIRQDNRQWGGLPQLLPITVQARNQANLVECGIQSQKEVIEYYKTRPAKRKEFVMLM